MADINDYIKGLNYKFTEQEKLLMNIFAECWEHCNNRNSCTECEYANGNKNIKMASCKDCMHEKVCDYFAGDMNEEGAENCVYFKDRNRFVELPCKVKDLIDTIISHNEIVGIWERRKNKEGRHHALLWKGMAWDVPEEYLDRTFLKIFGTVPESITEADTINISVTPIIKSVEEAERALDSTAKSDS